MGFGGNQKRPDLESWRAERKDVVPLDEHFGTLTSNTACPLAVNERITLPYCMWRIRKQNKKDDKCLANTSISSGKTFPYLCTDGASLNKKKCIRTKKVKRYTKRNCLFN